MIYRSSAPLQASDLVKCVHRINRVRAISKVKVKCDPAFESSFKAQHINSGSRMPAFYLQYNYPTIKLREKVLTFIFLLRATEMSRTVKQPIRAELHINFHDPPNNSPFHSEVVVLLLPKPHTFYVDIREQFKILFQCILWHL